MALPDLTGEKVNDTYQRLLQKSDDGQIIDGTGSAFIPANLIVTESLSVSGSIDISLASGSAFTITETDKDLVVPFITSLLVELF